MSTSEESRDPTCELHYYMCCKGKNCRKRTLSDFLPTRNQQHDAKSNESISCRNKLENGQQFNSNCLQVGKNDKTTCWKRRRGKEVVEGEKIVVEGEGEGEGEGDGTATKTGETATTPAA